MPEQVDFEDKLNEIIDTFTKEGGAIEDVIGGLECKLYALKEIQYDDD